MLPMLQVLIDLGSCSLGHTVAEGDQQETRMYVFDRTSSWKPLPVSVCLPLFNEHDPGRAVTVNVLLPHQWSGVVTAVKIHMNV